MKRRKVLALLTTAVMTFSSVAPEGVLLVRAEDSVTEAENEAEELPYNLKGMPEGYELDATELEMKASLKENEALNVLFDMTPGVDYVEDTVICLADDEEEAQIIAEAYNAELICYAQGVAEIRLPENLSVAEALSVAQDENYKLPVVEPNYLRWHEDPEVVDLSEFEQGDVENIAEEGSVTEKTPALVWQDWVMGSNGAPARFSNPDTYIQDPASQYYQWFHETIGTYNAWQTTMGAGVTVAVIDDGTNPSHPDLQGRVKQIQVNKISPSAYTDSHGTHVAGLIAASANNGIGGAGVAPEVNILALNVFGKSDQSGSADEIRALEICLEQKVPVVNMSLGGYGYSASEERIIQQLAAQGCCVFAAAGNENSEMKHYPAAYRDTISVASVNISGQRSNFSNYGSWVDIAVPGSNIMSCYNPQANDKKNSVDGKGYYGLMSGTSMACPIAAGVGALYVSVYGAIGPVRMRQVLQASATKAGSKKIGKILNVGKLLSASGAKTKASQSEDKKSFTLEIEGAGEGAYVLYTTDGSEPALMNGAIISGTVYQDSVELIPAEGEDSVTVKTLVVTANGEVGEVESFRFDVPVENVQDQAAAKKDAAAAILVTDVYGRVVNGKASLFSVNVPGTTYDDSALILNSPLSGTWTSSNSNVLQLSATEGSNVTAKALKAGSAKITFKGSDGGKAVISVKVTVPVSSLTLSMNGEGAYCGSIALGKSVKLSPAIGSAYGKPSNKKLEWSFSVNNDLNLTNQLIKAKAIKISSKGKVSINKKKWDSVTKTSDLLYADVLYVTAATTDGTGLSDTASLIVHKCATYFALCDSSLANAGITTMDIRTGGSWINAADEDYVAGLKLYLAVDTRNFTKYDVEITSSNPNLIAVKPLGPVVGEDKEPYVRNLRLLSGGKVIGERKVCFYAIQAIAQNTGTPRLGSAKITVKLLDGSNKKVTFKLNLING